MLSLVARDAFGGFAPGRYFPDRTPCASGDHTICEILSPSFRYFMRTFEAGRYVGVLIMI